MYIAVCVCVLLTVTGASVFDLEDEASRARGPVHLTLTAVGGVVTGAHALSGVTLGTLALTHGASSTTRPRVPQTLLTIWTADVVA